MANVVRDDKLVQIEAPVISFRGDDGTEHARIDRGVGSGLLSGSQTYLSSRKEALKADETAMASPPTVTFGAHRPGASDASTTVISGSVLTAWNAANAPFRFSLAGTPIIAWNGNYGAPTDNAPNTGPACTTWRIAFDTDAPSFEFRTVRRSGVEIRIWVNEQLAAAAPTVTDPDGTNDNQDELALVAFGSRAYRRIVIEFDGDNASANHPGGFGGIRCLATDTLYPPMIPNGPSFVVVGDSYSNGASADGTGGGANASPYGYPNVLGRILGFPNTKVLGANGTGFLKDSGQQVHYRSRIADLAAAAPEILLIQGSVNDSPGWVAGAVQTEVTAYLNAIRASSGLSRIPIFVTGILRPGALAGNDASVEAEIKAAVAALVTAGDLHLFYIDPSTGGQDGGRWFNGTGKGGSTAGNGNADFARSADDHPTPAGSRQIAYRLAAAMLLNLKLTAGF